MKELRYDVVVCGAGVAGVAAAVAAARQGAKTALIEKQCLIGGLATSGLIYIYLPICDGNGKQLAFGLAEEMLRRCVEYGPFAVPERWGGPAGGNPGIAGERCQCCFSPAGFTLTLDKMLEEAGVDLWLDTLIADARREKERIVAVEVENLSGRLRIAGKCFVDSTDPGGPGAPLFGEKFYRDLKRALRPGGVIATQSESPWLLPDVVKNLNRAAKAVFRFVGYAGFQVPTYPTGMIGACVATDARDVTAPCREVAPELAAQLRYYTAEIHRASFAQPAFLRELLT